MEEVTQTWHQKEKKMSIYHMGYIQHHDSFSQLKLSVQSFHRVVREEESNKQFSDLGAINYSA